VFFSHDFFYRNGLPYPSDFVSFSFLFVFAVFIIYIPLAYYLNFRWIMVISVFLSVILALAILFLRSYGLAMADSMISYRMPMMEFFVTAVLFAAALMFVYAGAREFAALLKGDYGRIRILVLWVCAAVSLPFAFYFKEAGVYRSILNNNVMIQISCISGRFYPVIIRELRFQNTGSGREKNVLLRTGQEEVLSHGKYHSLGIVERESESGTYIPYKSDRLYFEYYSPAEKKLYKDYGVFKFEKLSVERGPGRQRYAGRMELVFRPGGRIDFFDRRRNLNLFYYTDIKSREVSDSEHKEIMKTAFSMKEISFINRIIGKSRKMLSGYRSPEVHNLKYSLDIESYWMSVRDSMGFVTNGSVKTFGKEYRLYLPEIITVTDKSPKGNTKKYRLILDVQESVKISDKLAIKGDSETPVTVIISLKNRTVSYKKGSVLYRLKNIDIRDMK